LHTTVLALGLWFAFRPTLASDFARLQADPGDTLLNHYALEHSWRCLTQRDYAGSLWSPAFFHPQPLVLAYSENLLGTAPLYWLPRLVCPPAAAYQLWMMLAALASRWGDWSPWHAVYRWVPGGEAIRAVGRVVFTVELFALVGALVALEGLLQRCSLSWRAAFGWALLVAGIVEQMPVRELPSFELAPWQARVAALRERMTTGTVAYVELPPGRPFWQGQLQAMWAGLEANVPVVNGYSGRYPTGYPDWTRTMTDAELHDWLAGRADSRPVVKLSGD
jgi:hypothetical protein